MYIDDGYKGIVILYVCIYIYIYVYMNVVCIYIYILYIYIPTPSDTLRTWKWSPTHSDTLRTWKWSPTRGDKCYPRWMLQINRDNGDETKPEKARFDMWFTMICHLCTKSRRWSYGRYAHSGIRVRPKTRENDKFRKRPISLKNNSLKLKVCFS